MKLLLQDFSVEVMRLHTGKNVSLAFLFSL